jgi:hypothetical protein
MLIGAFPSRAFPDRAWPGRAWPGYATANEPGVPVLRVRMGIDWARRPQDDEEEVLMMLVAAWAVKR